MEITTREPAVRKFNQLTDGPQIGQWYWVDCEEDAEGDRTKKKERYLFCVRHLASNHVQFARCTPKGNESWVSVRYRDLAATTVLEPKWQAIKNEEIENKKIELQSAVRQMTDAMRDAGLIAAEGESSSMLPTLTRHDPADSKRMLQRLKDKTYPELSKSVELITQQITALHRELMLPMQIQSERMGKAVEKVDERLFALELYAGLFQGTILLRDGDPPDAHTPITVRQMLRYMDEECLINYDRGGIDINNVGDFDKWVIKQENLDRIAPEQRCVVALRVRRNSKDYGPCLTLFDAWNHADMNRANMFTYLLIRNGQQVHRLWAEIDFNPRLLPYRDEFVRPFEEVSQGWYNFKKGKRDDDTVRNITPDDLDYDSHVDKRKKKLYQYNRVMFLIQGLLDRSKVFTPHPPINLGDEEHVQRYFKAVYDEELGLPSANPPTWEAYRDFCNAQIVRGSFVWTKWHAESDYQYSRHSDSQRLRNGRGRPIICEVDRVSRDRTRVRIKWPWGTRYGREFPGTRYSSRVGKYYGSSGEWGEWPVDKERHAWIPIKECFNCSAYKTGDYKKFLCDAYLKGAYLQWAPQLLGAEDWLKRKKSK